MITNSLQIQQNPDLTDCWLQSSPATRLPEQDQETVADISNEGASVNTAAATDAAPAGKMEEGVASSSAEVFMQPDQPKVGIATISEFLLE